MDFAPKTPGLFLRPPFCDQSCYDLEFWICCGGTLALSRVETPGSILDFGMVAWLGQWGAILVWYQPPANKPGLLEKKVRAGGWPRGIATVVFVNSIACLTTIIERFPAAGPTWFSTNLL